MINIGIIGLNEGNGHPISFSCIINGYDDAELKKVGWDVIYKYISIYNNWFCIPDKISSKK